MNIASLLLKAFSVCAAVAVLAACSSNVLQSALGPSTGAWRPGQFTGPLSLGSPRFFAATMRITAHPDRGRSWMAFDAKKADLLYIADTGTNDVYVYSYPKNKLEGTLTGFNSPGGLCVNKAGDVFITNVLGWDVLEYAHGGTKPIATLAQAPYSFPYACSIDPATGNLAVTDIASGAGSPSGEGPGSLLIYKNAHGTPRSYSTMYHPYYCGYDAKGNLFIDGEGAGFSTFMFGELPKGKKFTNIALNQSFVLAGGVQWDGSNIAVGDSDSSVIYQFITNGKNGTEVGSTPLMGTNVVWQFWVQGQKVVAPNSYHVGSQNLSNVLFYNYPAGGSATGALGGSVDYPDGVTVSVAK